jgi:hypothetical protein
MWGHDSTVWRSTMGNTQALDLGWDWSEGRHQGAANVRFVTTRFDSVAFQHRGSLALSIICCGNDTALRGNTVPAKSQRLALLVVLVMGLLMVSPLGC